VKQQVPSNDRVEQPNNIEDPRSLPSSKKRIHSEASGSLRARKAAKVSNSKVILHTYVSLLLLAHVSLLLLPKLKCQIKPCVLL
jgi:hypothetical protein